MVFGSCRVAAPARAAVLAGKDEDERGRGIDALYAYARRMIEQPPEEWPHVLLWLGDQVYADEVSPGTQEFIEKHRDAGDGRRPASRSPTSRSTRTCTTTRGPTRRSAGCCRRCRAR